MGGSSQGEAHYALVRLSEGDYHCWLWEESPLGPIQRGTGRLTMTLLSGLWVTWVDESTSLPIELWVLGGTLVKSWGVYL